MSYLNQGGSSPTYCEVIKLDGDQNFAIYMGSDPSLVTCTKTSSPTGVYSTEDLDNAITDTNIINVVRSWYDRKTDYNNLTVRELIAAVLSNVASGKKVALLALPKMTKVLASNLSAIKELMVIYRAKGVYNFLCFGYREPIAQFLDKLRYDALYLFPERFYTAASFETRFKNNFTLCYDNQYCEVLGIVNPDEDKISLLMPVEWTIHSEALAKGFVEN